MPVRILNLVALISGRGSNLQSIIERINEGRLDAKIAAVISDREQAYGLVRARAAGIAGLVIRPEVYARKAEYENELAQAVANYNPDLVILAGFMRILGGQFVQQFHGRLVNIHPSLLPNYKGLNTHQRVLDAGDKTHGATVHFVTAQLDAGPTIIQAQVAVDAHDDAATLRQKVLREEHKIYPRAIQWIAEGKVNFAHLIKTPAA
ncbi:phosphoribosylglycinamide formyltransferase [Candidatus Spongiihabitans sp.]|uniref:phosphoribosylglycinamide formyltransferase n=1 Tax=Candidatus Spongiihabitans sp. TaxID=3101308 RepID=UPI003C7CDE39